MHLYKLPEYPNDTNLNIKSQSLNIELNHNGETGDFISDGYNYEVGDFHIKNYKDRIVQIAGEVDTRISVIADKLHLEGIALFKLADIYPQKVLVGGRFGDSGQINCAKGGIDGDVPSLANFKESFLELYNTDLYLLKNDYIETAPSEVYMCAPSAIGYPWDDGSTWKPANLKKTGARIISKQSVTAGSDGKYHYYDGFIYRTRINECNFHSKLLCYDRHTYLKVNTSGGSFAAPTVDSHSGTVGAQGSWFYYHNDYNHDLPACNTPTNGHPNVSSVWKYTGLDAQTQVSCYNEDGGFSSHYNKPCTGAEIDDLRDDRTAQVSQPIVYCNVVQGFYKCSGR